MQFSNILGGQRLVISGRSLSLFDLRHLWRDPDFSELQLGFGCGIRRFRHDSQHPLGSRSYRGDRRPYSQPRLGRSSDFDP